MKRGEGETPFSPFIMLKKLFLVIVIVYIPIAILSAKYYNHHTLCFIFGKKGAGKSCFMIREMKKLLNRGWNVYTDMQDCILPGVRIIDWHDLIDLVPETHSAVFLDEVGISLDNRKFKSFPDGLRDFFKYQRKYRLKVYMNSQAFDVDIKVRNVVDSMILQTSFMNIFSISRPIRRSFCLTEASADAESRIADKLKFAPIWEWRIYYMPKYFRYFDSFDAPYREKIPYREVKKDVKSLREKNARKAIRDEKNN